MIDMQNRYSRQMLLREIGEEGQKRIGRMRCLVIGAGGVGGPTALGLAEAGVGSLTIVDADTVDVSNLPRQILHTPARVGMNKAESARITLAEVNPEVPVRAVSAWADDALLTELASEADIILDCSDNFRTRHTANRVARATRRPLITAASVRFCLQVSMFDFADSASACYACIFPEDDQQDIKASAVGVFSPVTALAGMIAAGEALKWGAGKPSLAGHMLMIDTLTWEMRRMRLARDPECRVCGSN
ncbi:MAG: HesA/MoeB/ThiF family protein [Duodenibacillus sp.]